jgi:hypothetical protein
LAFTVAKTLAWRLVFALTSAMLRLIAPKSISQRALLSIPKRSFPFPCGRQGASPAHPLAMPYANEFSALI